VAKEFKSLKNKNSHITTLEWRNTLGIDIDLLSNQLHVSTDQHLDLSPVFNLTKSSFELISDLNPELRLELVGHNLNIKGMSTISDGIAHIIAHQMENWNEVGGPPYRGKIAASSSNWDTASGIRKPDTWWMRRATYNGLNPAATHQLPGCPDVVVEVISPSQSFNVGQDTQQDKMGDWITDGAEFGVLVDYKGRATYFYATTASGILPAPGAAAGVIAHPNFPGVTERRFAWGGVAPAGPGPHFGPALNIPFPANTHMTNIAPFSLNHATFEIA